MVLSKPDKKIKQLNHILKDKDYYMNDNYRSFINDMHAALRNDRKITEKMDSAINGCIRGYTKHLHKQKDSKLQKKLHNWTENTIAKLNMIRRTLDKCDYTRGYKKERLYFLESIERQVYSRGKLSVKQRKALNSMYNQFEKKLKKSEKKA